MKLGLVNINRDIFSNQNMVAPLGICSIATYLKEYGGFDNTIIIDQNVENIYSSIKRIKPDIVGISSVTQNFGEAERFANFVKQQLDIPIILGGVHISMLPSFCPKNVDLGVIGEGEETMLELLQLFEKSGEFQLNKLKGICYFKDEKLRINDRRPLIEPLDKIPIPDRSLLNMKHYLKRTSIVPFQPRRNAHILTSRGCPYKCVFCSTSAFWQKFRAFSADRVVAEITELIDKYNVELIHIFDDLFIANKKRFIEIVERIKKEKINEKIKFMCLARADLLNDEVMRAFKDMNVVCIGFGMESGSEKVLNYLKRDTVTVKQNRAAKNIALNIKSPLWELL